MLGLTKKIIRAFRKMSLGHVAVAARVQC